MVFLPERLIINLSCYILIIIALPAANPSTGSGQVLRIRADFLPIRVIRGKNYEGFFLIVSR
jgi:hypothetical protein